MIAITKYLSILTLNSEMFIPYIFSIAIPLILSIITYKIITHYPNRKSYIKRGYNNYPIVSEKTLRNFGFDNREQLTDKLTELFKKMDIAISNHDTKTLKKYVKQRYIM